jgi:hypothetical protein
MARYKEQWSVLGCYCKELRIECEVVCQWQEDVDRSSKERAMKHIGSFISNGKIERACEQRGIGPMCLARRVLLG